MNSYILRSVWEKCPAGTVIRIAVTPILIEFDSGFQRRGNLFLLALGLGEEGERQVINDLRERLSVSEGDVALLTAPSLDAYHKYIDTAWFEVAMQANRFTTHFQPIVFVDAEAPRLFADECLIRLTADRTYSGVEVVDAAVARRLSIRSAAAQNLHGTKLFINFMSSSIYEPAFCMASTLEEMDGTGIRPADVVFEVVESDHVRDIKHLAGSATTSGSTDSASPWTTPVPARTQAGLHKTR